MRGLLFTALPLLWVALWTPAHGEAAGCDALTPGSSFTVAQVLDGETLLLHDGTQLRLAGILAPRAGDAGAKPGSWPIEVTARAELEALALGKTVELRFGTARQDRYGRHLAQAYAIAASGERLWLQGALVRLGLARAFSTPQTRACAPALLGEEQTARQGALGMWTEAAYRIRKADQPEALLPLRGSFQVVEGRIRKLVRTRHELRLELGTGQRNFALRVRVPLARAGEGSQDLSRPTESQPKEGAAVRVHGWIEERANGPAIDLASGGDLELLRDEPQL